MKFIFSTFNIANKVPDNYTSKAKEIIHIYESEHIDILCMQEVSPNHYKAFKRVTSDTLVGKFRWGEKNLWDSIRFVHNYNEATPILTGYRMSKRKTVTLPWFPKSIPDLVNSLFKAKSLTPRVATMGLITFTKTCKVFVINTHIEKKIEDIQRRQLNKLYEVVRENSDKNIILTGDFNMSIDNSMLQKFEYDLQKLGVYRLEIEHRTFKKAKHNKEIDHIFYSKNLRVCEYRIIENDVSDHYQVLATFEIKEEE